MNPALFAFGLIAVFVIACYAAPPTPSFPSAFKTGFDYRSKDDNKTNSYGKWEFSLPLKSESFLHYFHDSEVEYLRRYDTGKQYQVVREVHGKATCHISTLDGSLSAPNFSNYTYTGTVHFQGHQLDEWTNTKDPSGTEYFYDYSDASHNPYEFVDSHGEFIFHDWAPGTQSSAEFAVPRECNTTSVAKSEIQAPMSCSFTHKLACAAILAGCGAACCLGACIEDPGCWGCMGGLYETCKDCF